MWLDVGRIAGAKESSWKTAKENGIGSSGVRKKKNVRRETDRKWDMRRDLTLSWTPLQIFIAKVDYFCQAFG